MVAGLGLEQDRACSGKGQAVARRGPRARLPAQTATRSGTAWSDLATVFVVLVLCIVARPALHLTHVVVTGTEARRC